MGRARVVPVVLALTCVVLASSAAADPAASRVIDRTFLCETGLVGGIYQVEIAGSDRVGQGPLERQAFTNVTSPQVTLAGIGVARDSVQVNVEDCKAKRAPVALSTKGLSGGTVGQLDRSFDCPTPRRFLLRVRALFDTATSLRVVRPFGHPLLKADGAPTEAAFALQAQTGRRIAYASVKGARARIFTAKTCEED